MAEEQTQLTDEQIRQQMETPPAAQLIEFKTETGQVYKGKDWEAVAGEMAKAQENATRTIREQREEYEQERQRLLDEIEQSRRKSQQPAERNASKFDKLRYYQTWQEDPYEAERQVIRKVLAEEFSVQNFDELRDGFNFAYQKTLGLHQNEEIFKFHAAHPDFSGSDEDAAKIADYLEKSGYQMNPSRGQFVTARDLEYAWYKLIEAGEVKPQKHDEQIQSRPAPPPSLGGASAGHGPSIEERAASMSDKELEAELQKLGMFK